MLPFVKLIVFSIICFNVCAGDLPTSYYINGKTYQSKDSQIDVTTESNSTINVFFLGNVAVSLTKSTKFSINQAYTDYIQPTNATVIKPNKINYTFSIINGTVNIINNNPNCPIVIHTPRVNIILNKGKFLFIVTDQVTTLGVISGFASILNVIEDKHFKLIEGNCGIITKHIPLSTKDANFYSSTKSTISTKPIQSDDLNDLSITFDKLTQELYNIIFVSINENIYGVKNAYP